MVYQNNNKFYLHKQIGSIYQCGADITIQTFPIKGNNMFRVIHEDGRINIKLQLGLWDMELKVTLWPDDVPF